AHFYIGTLGILMYVIAMWVSGVTQGMMWRAVTPQGGLMYPSFVETLLAIRPMYIIRAVGGTLYLAGMAILAWKLIMTARAGQAGRGEAMGVPRGAAPLLPLRPVVFGRALVVTAIVMTIALLVGFLDTIGALGFLMLGVVFGVGGGLWVQLTKPKDQPTWHRILEGRPLLFVVLSIVAVLIGGAAEIIPSLVMNHAEQG